jgi:hypothetical protein
VEHDAQFNILNGVYTNNGLLKISNGDTLTITNAGNLTNQSGSTLIGGTFDIQGIIKYPGASVQTNQAEIILRGAGSTIRNDSNSDALAVLSTNGASGKLRLLEGRDFFPSNSSFTNDGVLELGGTIFQFFNPVGGSVFTNTATGQLIGAGLITSNSLSSFVNNSGLVSPGSATAAGILDFVGNYTQSATGSLAIGVSGTNNSNPQNPQFDALQVDGSATLDGSLVLSLFGGFTPSFAHTFKILDASSGSGVFANAPNGQRLNTIGNEGSFVVSYSGGDVILSSFIISGDYNGNGTVDAADYVVWRNDPLRTPAGYTLWRSNFGRSNVGSGAGVAALPPAVPEPHSAAIVVLAAAALLISASPRDRCRDWRR